MTGSVRTTRRPGLQGRWRHVVESLESIIPIYEVGSSRIALFSDKEMRLEVVKFAVERGSLVLDLGSGPGAMSRLVSVAGGIPVMLDASRRMLLSAPPFERVQSTFEYLPFRGKSFSSVVAGFSLRDSRDLYSALAEVSRVVAREGKFSYCDLGKSESKPKKTAIAFYIGVIAPIIGLLTGGRPGLGFASLYGTYLLALDNRQMAKLLRRHFSDVELTARMLGGSIVAKCSRTCD